MSFVAKTSVQKVTTTLSTAQLTLVEFDITALPGVGQALVAPFVILANVKLFATAAPMPDHSSRVWQQAIAWEKGAGVGSLLRVLDGPTEDVANRPNGLFGASTINNPTYDVSGNLGRLRMIPYSTSSITWYARMDLTVLQG